MGYTIDREDLLGLLALADKAIGADAFEYGSGSPEPDDPDVQFVKRIREQLRLWERENGLSES